MMVKEVNIPYIVIYIIHYTTTHLSLIYEYYYIGLGETWGCQAEMTEPFHPPIQQISYACGETGS